MADDGLAHTISGEWAIDPEILREESARNAELTARSQGRRSTSSHESPADTSFASTTLTPVFDDDRYTESSRKRRKLTPDADLDDIFDDVEVVNAESQRQWQSFAGPQDDQLSPGMTFISRNFASKARKPIASRGRGRPAAITQGFKTKDILTLARSLPHDSTSFKILQSEEFLSSFDLSESRLDKLKGSLGKMGRKAELAFKKSTMEEIARKRLGERLDKSFDTPHPTTERGSVEQEYSEDELEVLGQQPIISQPTSQRHTPVDLPMGNFQHYQPVNYGKRSTSRRDQLVSNNRLVEEESRQAQPSKKKRGRPRKPTPELARPRRGSRKKDPSQTGTHYGRPPARDSTSAQPLEMLQSGNLSAGKENSHEESPVLVVRNSRLETANPLREIYNLQSKPKVAPPSAIYENLLKIYRICCSEKSPDEYTQEQIDADLNDFQALSVAERANMRKLDGTEALTQRRCEMDRALGLSFS